MRYPDEPKNIDRIVIETKKGNLKAFDQIYNFYSQRLYGFAFSLLKNHEDAKEIVQETFIKLWNKREQINPGQSFKTFLFTISYNTSIDLLRKRLKEDRFKDHLKMHLKIHEQSADSLITYKELNGILQKAIDKLPSQQKKVFLMSREEGLSYKEISKKLDISLKTIESHIYLALKTIREKMGSDKLSGILFIALFL